MQTIEKTVEVEWPVRAVYNQWMRFQDFPQFMSGIKDVRIIDATHQHWTAMIGGRATRWDAEVLEQIPDQRISWRSTSGAENSGNLVLIALSPTRTRLILCVNYDPKGVVQNIGANLGLVSSRVMEDLDRFKIFVEGRGVPTTSVPGPGTIAPNLPGV